MSDKIKITGAREHNLKNVDVEIPKNQFVVITGSFGKREIISWLLIQYILKDREIRGKFVRICRMFIGQDAET